MIMSELTVAGQRKRFTVTRGETGWDVREESDSTIVREANYTDWHRVERALRMFALQLRDVDDPDTILDRPH